MGTLLGQLIWVDVCYNFKISHSVDKRVCKELSLLCVVDVCHGQ
jgi:hypothetical protein